MGCSSSTGNVVEPLTPEEGNGDEGDSGGKLRSCGDSAVSKGTTDSGVVMEREIPMLPGAVPRILAPLTSEWIAEGPSGFLQQDIAAQERQNSSEILEELLSQGIIPTGQSREKSSGAGEAYSIMLNDTEAVRRRPPARLEALKAKKEQSLTSKEDLEEKMKLAEERRKLREDKLKMRLRAKSARVRAPISQREEGEGISPVEPLESLSSDHRVECERETGGGSKEGNNEMGRAEERERKGPGKVGAGGIQVNRGKHRESISEDSNEEEEFLIAQEVFETDSSFQRTENNVATF